MKIGIGLPNAVVGVDRAGIVDWAQRAEAAGFSALGTLDRVAYPNYDNLLSLTAAAAVTEKVELVTDILLAPLRSNTAQFAKQAATLQSLSGGRLVLGLAPGGREDDYEQSEVPFKERGRIFDAQLERLPGMWESHPDTGPSPALDRRPTLLIGGSNERSFNRAAKHADGWTMGGGTPGQFAESLAKVKEIWKAEGRDGEPRTMALCYFALGDGGKEAAEKDLGHYYAWLGDEVAGQIVGSAVTDAETGQGYRDAFAEAGCDELIYFPASSDPAQVELLAEAVL